MGGSKTTNKSTTNQTQTAAPPTWTLPQITDLSGMVGDALTQLPTSHYTGPQVATMDPATLAAIQQAWGATAANAGQLSGFEQGLLPQLTAPMSFTTGLPTTAITAQPLQDATAAIQASMVPVMHNLTENILPGITSSALASGAYSGDRAMGVIPTQAIRDANQAMSNTAAQLGYTAYEDYAQRDLAAQQAAVQAAQQNYALDSARQQAIAGQNQALMSLIPGYTASILHNQAASGDLLNMAAQLGLTNQQAGYNNSIAMDQYAAQAPFMGMDQAAAILQALSGNWGTQTLNGTTTQTQTTKPSLAGQLIQGAIGLGSMAAGFPGLGSALGFGGAAAPAAAGLFNINPGTANYFAANPFGG